MGGTTEGDAAKVDDEDEDVQFEEDMDSDEGAIYPLSRESLYSLQPTHSANMIIEGRITNLPAFLAFLNHIHNVLSPTLHTPILLIAQPAWTAQDHENLTQFFFEKFKTPAFCIMDSALATTYAMGVSSATVIDVGYQKGVEMSIIIKNAN